MIGGFWVELARSGEEYYIPEGRKILEVLYEAGIDVDYSCELGICGACETRVISGIPEHHDSVLSEEEQATNEKVMICCCGCKTERLVLGATALATEGSPAETAPAAVSTRPASTDPWSTRKPMTSS